MTDDNNQPRNGRLRGLLSQTKKALRGQTKPPTSPSALGTSLLKRKHGFWKLFLLITGTIAVLGFLGFLFGAETAVFRVFLRFLLRYALVVAIIAVVFVFLALLHKNFRTKIMR